MSYIDDCDTLGQKADRLDIHKVLFLWLILSSSSNILQILVLVYEKILEFYGAAVEILTRKRAKRLQMFFETDRIPNIVQYFLTHADTLQNIIQKATFDILDDIKATLYVFKSKYLGFWAYCMHD